MTEHRPNRQVVLSSRHNVLNGRLRHLHEVLRTSHLPASAIGQKPQNSAIQFVTKIVTKEKKEAPDGASNSVTI